MTRMTNNAGVDLAAAIWLAHDDYDYVDKPNYISVTTLIKPPRQIILGQRVALLAKEKPEAVRPVDIIDRFKSRLGQSLHTGVEYSWKDHYRTSMQKLGIPNRVIDMVRINPECEEPDTIPVYTEQRVEKEIAGHVVGGKIDLIIEGRLRDVKSTTVFKYMRRGGVEQWRLQGSLYRWLNPEKVHHGEFLVQYLLVDWVASIASRTPGYPAHPAVTRTVQLMGVGETETWIRNRLQLLQQLATAPDDQLPDCTEDDLWRSEPVFKYYASGQITARSTKNFDSEVAAMQYRAEKGKGIVVSVPGVVKACNYCECRVICGQYQRLLANGDIAADEP